MNTSLEESDPEMFDIIEHEKHRQMSGLQLIPSENFTSQAVLDAVRERRSSRRSALGAAAALTGPLAFAAADCRSGQS